MRLINDENNPNKLILRDANIAKLVLFGVSQFIIGLLLISSSLLSPILALCAALPGILLALTSPLWLFTIQQLEAEFDKGSGTVTIRRRSRFVLGQPEQYALSQIYEIFVDRQSPVPFWWQMRQTAKNPDAEPKAPGLNDRHHIVMVMQDRLQVPLSTAKLRRQKCETTAVALKNFLGK